MATIKGIFTEEKKIIACKRIANDLVQACANSVYVVESLNSISQNPDIYPNPKLLLNEWTEYLFQADFNLAKKEFRMEPNKFSQEVLQHLRLAFFNYFMGIIPIYFWKKKIEPSIFGGKKKYQWSNYDFTTLRNELLISYYSTDYENAEKHSSNPKNHEKVNLINTEKNINYSSKVMHETIKCIDSLWKKNIDWVFNTQNIYHIIRNNRKKNDIYYKEDIFWKSLNLFLNNLISSLDNYISDFYLNGSALHKYFKWSQ